MWVCFGRAHRDVACRSLVPDRLYCTCVHVFLLPCLPVCAPVHTYVNTFVLECAPVHTCVRAHKLMSLSTLGSHCSPWQLLS